MRHYIPFHSTYTTNEPNHHSTAAAFTENYTPTPPLYARLKQKMNLFYQNISNSSSDNHNSSVVLATCRHTRGKCEWKRENYYNYNSYCFPTCAFTRARDGILVTLHFYSLINRYVMCNVLTCVVRLGINVIVTSNRKGGETEKKQVERMSCVCVFWWTERKWRQWQHKRDREIDFTHNNQPKRIKTPSFWFSWMAFSLKSLLVEKLLYL